METTAETTPKEAIMQWAEKHGVTMRAEFVPLSQSRNKGEKHPTLNWRVTLSRNGRDILTTDYSAGCGHCPSYKFAYEGGAYHKKNQQEQNIAWECENGFQVRKDLHRPEVRRGTGKIAILPDFADVLYSLSLDSAVIDAGGFEQWAAELGYDTDSRAAEAVYRACLDTALKMRAAIGDAAMGELATATQDY